MQTFILQTRDLSVPKQDPGVSFFILLVYFYLNLFTSHQHICMIQNIGFTFTGFEYTFVHMRESTLKNILFLQLN